MIDHVLGRPSVRFRKYQVLLVVAFWTSYLYKGNNHGPIYVRRLSRFFSKKLTVWQTILTTLLTLYVSRNFAKLTNLESPEPLANLYTRSYFRATWVTTALDAGFWTAMPVKPAWLRHFCSMIFSLYYLIVTEKADEKVRRVRGVMTVDHLRVSWNKGTTPILNFLNNLLRPRLMRYKPRAIRIPRPRSSVYRESVEAWLYFDGPIAALKAQTQVVLDIPGGGFVAMTPRNHDDKLLAWAGKTGLPVLSLNYKKAPEHPYPYALDECYDVYHTLIATRGRCIGMSGEHVPKVVISGDSAGGNLAVGTMIRIVQSASGDSRRWLGEPELPIPDGLVLVYPALDMSISSWMTDEQMALIRDRRTRKTNEGIIKQKSQEYKKLTPTTPYASDDELNLTQGTRSTRNLSKGREENGSVVTVIQDSPLKGSSARSSMAQVSSLSKTDKSTMAAAEQAANPKPNELRTRLAMSSMISYFNDRVLTPEMMRAMVILYVGPHNRPDFATDFLLCPLLAPENILARFPKTYFLTGERDPLVDDTVIFAGRLRQAHATRVQERKDLGLEKSSREFREEDYVEVVLIPGISHGFMQFAGVFPEGWTYIFRIGNWIEEIFSRSEEDAVDSNVGATPVSTRRRHHQRKRTMDSSGDDDRPLEMTVIRKEQDMSSATSQANGKVKKSTSPKKPLYRRRKSLVRLASEDDLLGRRMKGFTTALLLDDRGDFAIPPTP